MKNAGFKTLLGFQCNGISQYIRTVGGALNGLNLLLKLLNLNYIPTLNY